MDIEERAGSEQWSAGDADVHDTETVEQGAFAHARCSCGWRGPARRARERARADASGHLPDVG